MGTGTPYRVTEIVNAFEGANGIKVKHEFGQGARTTCRNAGRMQVKQKESSTGKQSADL